MRVPVACGTRMGGTAGIAEMVGDALTAEGLQIHVQSASERADIGAYDAVIVGGAPYNNRWHRQLLGRIRSWATTVVQELSRPARHPREA